MIRKLTMRPLERRDIAKLVTIVERVWDFSGDRDIRENHRLANVFLKACLVRQNFTQVALWNDEVVGVILAETKYLKKGRIGDFLRLGLAQLPLSFSHEGRQSLRLLKKNREIDKRLLTNFNQREYSGEVVLLVVDPAYQNLGIGRQLLASVADHWKIVPVSHYYLFADTACNYQFYKLMGLMEERKLQVKFDQQFKLTFFLYTGELNN
ncbi:GNAT family N-acetyltransferase [Secundilactobacillus yichangensis]|uniref:GNAT family N-acetyltransferase n=1 Tax=Secundilactobacillus yichangensis TaxID=2799580 RepID=UPI00194494E2|nr:GNAT family N-acetyltransferase [Secundilactobacillus yichangensis]